MESRVSKLVDSNENYGGTATLTRSSRHARLYREVYGKYDGIDHLPIEDNTDEIDMAKLKELVLNSNMKKENKKNPISHDVNLLQETKKNTYENKVYDINQILEKAKYENNKLKDSITNSNHFSKRGNQLLSTLENVDISLEADKFQKRESLPDENNKDTEKSLSMTRELKYQNLEKEIKKEMTVNKTNDFSLEMFEDLKPTGDTITTKPISATEEEKKESCPIKKENFKDNDKKNMDVVKNNNKIDNDFFTSSYEFSKKDFMVDEEFSDLKEKSSVWKFILLILAIFVFSGVIVYFVWNYGLGV